MLHPEDNSNRWKKRLFQPHPLLGYSFTPSNEILAPFRGGEVIQHIGPDGFRRVPFASKKKDKQKLVFYGCSFTFGIGLTDSEGFPAKIQKEFKDIHVSNKGVSGYSNVQNFLQFKQDVKNNEVDFAVFGFISRHQYRNLVTHPLRMTPGQIARWHQIGIEHMPRAVIQRGGEVEIEYVGVNQFHYERDIVEPFIPTQHMVDVATISLFEAISKFAEESGVKIAVALLDKRETDLNAVLFDKLPKAVNISIPINKRHTWLPVDTHPNVYGNKVYFDKLKPLIQSFLGDSTAIKSSVPNDTIKTAITSTEKSKSFWKKILPTKLDKS